LHTRNIFTSAVAPKTRGHFTVSGVFCRLPAHHLCAADIYSAQSTPIMPYNIPIMHIISEMQRALTVVPPPPYWSLIFKTTLYFYYHCPGHHGIVRARQRILCDCRQNWRFYNTMTITRIIDTVPLGGRPRQTLRIATGKEYATLTLSTDILTILHKYCLFRRINIRFLMFEHNNIIIYRPVLKSNLYTFIISEYTHTSLT